MDASATSIACVIGYTSATVPLRKLKLAMESSRESMAGSGEGFDVNLLRENVFTVSYFSIRRRTATNLFMKSFWRLKSDKYVAETRLEVRPGSVQTQHKRIISYSNWDFVLLFICNQYANVAYLAKKSKDITTQK